MSGDGPTREQPRELRIGDAERTAAADELAEHYAQGRLSAEEHSERLDRIWAAKTRTELAPVFADLPGSAYQRPAQQLGAYATADRPGVGQDRPRRAPRPFPAPPFGRPPFGRPPYAGQRGRAVARGSGCSRSSCASCWWCSWSRWSSRTCRSSCSAC